MASTVIPDWFFIRLTFNNPCLSVGPKRCHNFPFLISPMHYTVMILSAFISLYPKHTNVYKTVTRISSKSKWFVGSPEIRLRRSWLYLKMTLVWVSTLLHWPLNCIPSRGRHIPSYICLQQLVSFFILLWKQTMTGQCSISFLGSWAYFVQVSTSTSQASNDIDWLTRLTDTLTIHYWLITIVWYWWALWSLWKFGNHEYSQILSTLANKDFNIDWYNCLIML